MKPINFDHKTFKLVHNSEHGSVNGDTIFKFKQKDHLVTADYDGGSIKYGKIISILNDNMLEMVYQCLTTNNELRSGKARAKISRNEDQKLTLDLHWQ